MSESKAGVLAGLDTRSKVLGGVLLLALLLLGARLVLPAADDELLAAPVPVAPVAAALPTPSAEAAAEPEPAAPLPGGRDPFRALHVAGGSGGAGAPAAEPVGPPPAVPLPDPLPGTVPGSPADPLDAPAAGPAVPVVDLPPGPGPAATAPAPGSGAAPAPEAPPARTVALRSVESTPTGLAAVLAVDGAVHRLAVGEQAAGLTLRALQEGTSGRWTAVLQQEGEDPFDLVTGSPVRL